MENFRDALEYLVALGMDKATPEVKEICGKTYVNKNLQRYDLPAYAVPIKAATLSALVDYIRSMSKEFKEDMIIHIVNEKTVILVSALDAERDRETLFESQSHTSEYRFDTWYDQERFIIEMQSNFIMNEDLAAILKVAGNVEAKTTSNYGDDGMTQKTTIKNGITSKVDVIVPNPCRLIPYRTFVEIEQPASQFVFRIREESNGSPSFKLIEAEGGLWKTEAIARIKNHLRTALTEVDQSIVERITIIG